MTTELTNAVDEHERQFEVTGDPLVPGEVYAIDSELIYVVSPAYAYPTERRRRLENTWNVKRGVEETTAATHESSTELARRVPVYGETPVEAPPTVSSGVMFLGPYNAFWSDQVNLYGMPEVPLDTDLQEGDFVLGVMVRTTTGWDNDPDSDVGDFCLEFRNVPLTDSVRSDVVATTHDPDVAIFSQFRRSWMTRSGSPFDGAYRVGGEADVVWLATSGTPSAFTQGSSDVYLEVFRPG